MFDSKPTTLKVRVDATSLIRDLRLAHSVVEFRNTIPVLAMVQFDAKGDSLKLSVTDLDIFASFDVEAEVEGEGSFLLRSGPILRFLAGSQGSLVTFTIKGDEAEIEVGGCVMAARLIIPVEDMPEWKPADTYETFDVGEAALSKALTITRACISTEETRYYLNGLHLCAKPDGDTLRFVSTDGHRLAIYDLDTKAPSATGIIPRKTIDLLRKLVSDEGNGSVSFMWSDLKAEITTPRGVIRSKLIDGTYPNYAKVVPKEETSIRLTINEPMVKRLTAVSDQRSKAIEFDSKAQTAMARDPGADMSVTMPTAIDGPDCQFGFNGVYLMDWCRASKGPVSIEGSAPKNPFLVKFEDKNALGIQMPMLV